MKQILRIIYLVAFLAVSFRGAAYDAEAKIDGLLYGLDTSAGTATVLPGDYAFKSAVTIPTEVACEGQTYTVTAIADEAFQVCKLESVTFPETIVSIGDYSFYGCTNLKSISLPISLERIGSYAFSVSFIPFLTIPEKVAEIGECAFRNCVFLPYVEIPASVQKIGDCAFGYCHSLERISVDEGNAHYCSADGALFSKDMKSLVAYPAGCRAEDYEIPATVTTVYRGAFEGCSKLKKIRIPESVTDIGSYTFRDCYNLSGIYCNPIIPPDCDDLFDDFEYKAINLFVPEESAADYRAHHEWGKFARINDTSLNYSIYTETHCQCGRRSSGIDFKIGADVSYAKAGLVYKPYLSYTDWIEPIISMGITLQGRYVSVDTGEVDDYTSWFVMFVTLDSEGNPQKYAVSELVINGSDDNWETLDGLGHFTDGYMCRIYPDRADGIKDYDVTVQRSKTAPGCFRVVNPYPHEEWGNCIACKWGDHYLYINATDPDKVYVKASALGIGFGEDSGSMLMFTGNAYLASFYDDLETTDADYGTMDKNGLITLKGMAILGKEDSDPDTAPYDDEAYITLQLPASYSSGIDAVIEDDAEAPVEYYNLQGMRVHNIEGTGGIYIRRQGNKTAKVYVK